MSARNNDISGENSAGPSWANSNPELDKPTEPEKKNRPKDSKLRQQKLPAWQPILTAGTVIPTFFVIGLIFLPIGIGLFVSSQGIVENLFEYTDTCTAKGVSPSTQCKDLVRNWTRDGKNWDNTCTCTIDLSSSKTKTDLKADGDVYFYYGLTNFYQNHRRYVKSRSDNQLLGNLDDTEDCAPFQENETSKLAYAPCGAIANSMFNDTFKLWFKKDESSKSIIVPVDSSTITWPTDKNHKFRNPKGVLKTEFSKTSKPVNWKKQLWEMGEKDNNGFMNADFIVWMRTAALPTFRKLWRKLDRSKNETFRDGLPSGIYTLDVDYNYLVDSFGGQKRFIISTTSWVGGKNDFLGVAYMVVGSLCILLGVIFLGIHLKFGKSLTEMSAVHGGSRH